MTLSYRSGKDNTAVVKALGQVLADIYILYFKTHSFHWNVEGANFKALHELFEEQYTELWAATDEIAERIRALDAYAPVSWQEMVKNGTLQEAGQLPDSEGMIKQLADDNLAIVEQSIMPALHAAEEAGDEATVDMMVARTQTHEKVAWMLKSIAK